MKNATDGELMTWLAEGNQKAFQEIYRRYAAHVLGYSNRLLKNRGTSEEVSQEVWIKVVRAASSYRASGTLKSWLYTVTRRTAFNYLRDFSNVEEVSSNEIIDAAAESSVAEFEARVLARAEIAAVRRALDTLPNSQRVALTLWLTEELAYDQIAQQMGISESAVKSLLFRAREALNEALG